MPQLSSLCEHVLCAWRYQARGCHPRGKDDCFKFWPIVVQVREPSSSRAPQLPDSAEEQKEQDLCLVPCPKPWSMKCSSLGQITGCHPIHVPLHIQCQAESRELATVETFKAEEKARPS